MAKNKIEIDVKVDDKGTTKKVGLGAKKAGDQLGKLDTNARAAQKGIKGVAGTASAGAKNFSGMARGMGGLVGAYAAFAAQMFAVTAAFGFLKRAGDLSVMQAGQVTYASATGVAMRTLTKDIIAATGAQVTFRDAAQAVAIGTAAGITANQLERLGKAAKDTSAVLGRDVTDSFNRLVRGVTKAEPELLDELGIILRLETASKNYAETLGKTAKDLSQFEKSQAVVNEVLTQSESKYSRIMDIMGGSKANPFAKLGKAFDDIVISLSTAVLPAFTALAKVFTETPALAILAFGLLAKGPLAAMGFSLQGLVTKSEANATASRAHWEAQKLGAMDATKAVSVYTASLKTKAAAAMADVNTPEVKKSVIMQKLGKGDTLNKRQITQLSNSLALAKTKLGADGKVISGIFKGMTSKSLLEYERLVVGLKIANKKISVDTKATTVGISYLWAAASAGVTRAAAIMSGALMKVMAAAGWISILVTGVLLLKDVFFKPDYLSDSEKAMEALGEKVRSLNSDFQELIRVQKVMTEDNDFLGLKSIGGALGKVAGSLSQTQFKDMMQSVNNVKKAKQALRDIGQNDLAISHLSKKEGYNEAIFGRNSDESSIAGRKTFGGKSNRDTLMGTDDKDGAYQQNIKFIQTQLDLANELEKTYGSYSVITAYKNILNDINATPEAAEQARTSVMELGAEFKNLDNLRKASATAMSGIVTSFAPQSQEFRAVNELKKELTSLEKIRKDATQYDDTELGRMLQNWSNISDKASATNKEQRDQLSIQIAFIESRLRLQREAEMKAAKASTALAKAKNVQNTVDRNIATLEAQKLTIAAKQLKIQADITAEEDFRAKKFSPIITDDAQQTLDLNKEKLKVLKEETDEVSRKLRLVKETAAAQKASISAGFEKQIIAAEKMITAEKKKQLELQERIAIIAENRAKREFASEERNKGFGSSYGRDDRKVAFDLELAESQQKIRLDAIDAEAKLKKDMIKQEYKLLDIKRIQTKYELLALKQKMLAENPAADTGGISSLITDMSDGGSYQTTLGTAEKSATDFIDIWASDKASQVLDNIDKLKNAKDDLSAISQVSNTLESSLGDGLSTAFSDIITGTATVKDAFLGMAQAILQALANVFAELMAVYLLKMLFGGPTSSAVFMDQSPVKMPGLMDNSPQVARNGGVFSEGKKLQGYATGGIARGSTSGYPATLHGTEAVVPLPNGRSIPVQMQGNSSQQNNVVVNISNDGQTQTQNSSGMDGDKIGLAVAAAVQAELQNQKRSGGILNPYGVA